MMFFLPKAHPGLNVKWVWKCKFEPLLHLKCDSSFKTSGKEIRPKKKCSSGEMGQQMKPLEVITYLLINGIEMRLKNSVVINGGNSVSWLSWAINIIYSRHGQTQRVTQSAVFKYCAWLSLLWIIHSQEFTVELMKTVFAEMEDIVRLLEKTAGDS